MSVLISVKLEYFFQEKEGKGAYNMVIHYFLDTYCVPVIYVARVLKILSQLWEGSCVIFVKIKTENTRV